jgi:ergothioneine biosynthesis protein EgtB
MTIQLCAPRQGSQDKTTLGDRYGAVRRQTEALCEPLEVEDYVVQSMPDSSPVKWHLAHTTWFFETFLLQRYLPVYRVYHPEFRYLFNSYYNAVGPRWPRSERGLLVRPTVAEVLGYRKHVDEHMTKLLARTTDDDIAGIVMLGIHHEQQHQELILTDLKHAWAANPLQPVYRPEQPATGTRPARCWIDFPEGLSWIGHDEARNSGDGFSFDNERPRHRVFVHAFRLSNQLVTNLEYRAFMEDGGYNRPELWLSDGWAMRQARGWEAPLYWEREDEVWYVRSLSGRRPLEPAAPVCHVSYYEADAFACWADGRLPTEVEWETAAGFVPVAGHFLEGGHFQPAAVPAADDCGPCYQLYGDVWQWTASPYAPYPNFQPAAGALGEYNGKFMCNQFVLRGASCATPRSHARCTYRNFFPPEARWQFSGIRLAKELP